MNYQSKLLTAEDFEEATADSLITNFDNKKLFGIGTKIKDGTANFANSDLLVKHGLTKESVKVIINKTGSAGTVTLTLTDSATGISLFQVDGTTAIANAGTITTASLAVGTHEIEIAKITTSASGALGESVSIAYTSSSAGAATLGLEADTSFVIKVSDYPDVIELGERNAAAAPAQYRFVNVGLSVTGPSTLIESYPTRRAALLLANDKNGLVLFNQTGAAITEANAKLLFEVPSAFIQDGDGDHNDPQDVFTDGAGLNRRKLAITSTTVAGTYTLRFVVDSLVKEIKIQINNAQPKVFVLSGTDLVDGNDADVLTNNVVTSGGPSKVFVNVTGAQGNTAANSWQFAASGSAYARLQNYDQDGILPNAADFVPSLNDKFVAVKDGVYTFEAPNTTTLRDILFARIAVADIALGEYTYAISKEYPDGRLETYSDVVEVTALDNNQLAVFGGAPTKFTNNWIVNETSYKVGTYKYSFTLGSTTLAFQVVVTEKPTLNITRLNFGTTQVNLFEGNYVISKAALSSTAVVVDATFTLDGLTTSNYYTVTAADFKKDASSGRVDSGTLTVSELPASYVSLLDVTKLNLGKLVGATPLVGDYVEYTIKFFSKSGTTYTQVGEDLIINLVVNENAALINKYLVATSDGLITEQSEAGEVITIKSFGDTFVTGIVSGNVTITAQPNSGSALTVASVTRVDPNTLLVKLAGNVAAPYSVAAPALTFSVAAAGLTGAAILTATLNLTNNVAPLAATVVAGAMSVTSLKIDFAEQIYYKDETGTLVALPNSDLAAVIGALTVVENTVVGTPVTLAEALHANNGAGKYKLSYVTNDHTLTITFGEAQTAQDDFVINLLANKLFDIGGNAIAAKEFIVANVA
jgi:hypothetical protein